MIAVNMSRLIRGPHKFTVYRSSGKFELGGWKEGAQTVIKMSGLAHPTTPKDHDHLPEGDRIKESFTFYTIFKMFVSHNEPTQGTSDNVEYNGVLYNIHSVKDYSAFGYYKSIGVRSVGD